MCVSPFREARKRRNWTIAFFGVVLGFQLLFGGNCKYTRTVYVVRMQRRNFSFFFLSLSNWISFSIVSIERRDLSSENDCKIYHKKLPSCKELLSRHSYEVNE